jgi:hypothetical protein
MSRKAADGVTPTSARAAELSGRSMLSAEMRHGPRFASIVGCVGAPAAVSPQALAGPSQNCLPQSETVDQRDPYRRHARRPRRPTGIQLGGRNHITCDDVVRRFRPLLDLPVELVLTADGEPADRAGARAPAFLSLPSRWRRCDSPIQRTALAARARTRATCSTASFITSSRTLAGNAGSGWAGISAFGRPRASRAQPRGQTRAPVHNRRPAGSPLAPPSCQLDMGSGSLGVHPKLTHSRRGGHRPAASGPGTRDQDQPTAAVDASGRS